MASTEDYPKMILAAIEASDAETGSNKTAISKYIEANYPDLPPNHSTLLSDALDKMRLAGQVVFLKNNYHKPSSNPPPKRGRGRPPKPKTEQPTPASTGPARPRGRPPKPKDQIASPKPASSGRPRGRPPKKTKASGGVAAPAAAPAAVKVGEKRGRGRPPKVRPEITPAATAVES